MRAMYRVAAVALAMLLTFALPTGALAQEEEEKDCGPFAQLCEGLEQIGEELKPITDELEPLYEALDPALGPLLDALVPLIAQLREGLETVTGEIGAEACEPLAPLFDGLNQVLVPIDAILDTATDVLSDAVQPLDELLDEVDGILSAILLICAAQAPPPPEPTPTPTPTPAPSPTPGPAPVEPAQQLPRTGGSLLAGVILLGVGSLGAFGLRRRSQL
jgi:hypothetical protein